MAENLNPTLAPRHYLRRDPVARALGKRLGRTDEGARQVLVGSVRFMVAEVIASFDEVGEWERREAWLAPIRAAEQRILWERYSPDLEMKFQQADDATGCALLAFKHDPCPLHRDRLIRALLDQHITSLALAMALIYERKEQAA